MHFPFPKSTKSLSVRNDYSLPEPPIVLDKVSLWICLGWCWEESHSDTVTWDGGRVLSLLPPMSFSLGRTCSHLAVSVASTTPAVSLCPHSLQLLSPSTASSDRFCPIHSSHGAQGQGGNSPFLSKYHRPWVLTPGGGVVHGPARVEGTETHLGAEVQALRRFLPKEDILNSSKWLLPQIYAARSAELGSGSGSCSVERAQAAHSLVPCRWTGSCPLTHMPHTLVCVYTHSHLLSLTLSWIFELIALWVSCKIGPDLGTSEQSFQLLCSHLGYLTNFYLDSLVYKQYCS